MFVKSQYCEILRFLKRSAAKLKKSEFKGAQPSTRRRSRAQGGAVEHKEAQPSTKRRSRAQRGAAEHKDAQPSTRTRSRAQGRTAEHKDTQPSTRTRSRTQGPAAEHKRHRKFYKQLPIAFQNEGQKAKSNKNLQNTLKTGAIPKPQASSPRTPKPIDKKARIPPQDKSARPVKQDLLHYSSRFDADPQPRHEFHQHMKKQPLQPVKHEGCELIPDILSKFKNSVNVDGDHTSSVQKDLSDNPEVHCLEVVAGVIDRDWR